MPRALKNLDITLGLAVIPVQLFTATSSQGVGPGEPRGETLRVPRDDGDKERSATGMITQGVPVAASPSISSTRSAAPGIQMRLECPIHGIVPREETVKGYETAKDGYCA